MAAFQLSPKPICRAAFLISLRLNAYSRSAIAISSSALYGIISYRRSTESPPAPIGSPMIGPVFAPTSSDAAAAPLAPRAATVADGRGMPTTRSRIVAAYFVIASFSF